jgi:hypothetical protein
MISDEELFAAMRRVNAKYKRTMERLAESEKGERMTLPYEEVHSLQAVRRFLFDLLDPSATPRVPKAIRQRARRVCKHFPMDYSIQERYPEVFNPKQETTVSNTTSTTRKNYIAELTEQYLNNGETITVTFTKKDGTERVMYCTRNLAAIPEDKHPKGSGKAKAAHLIVAFDLQKGEWRSFDEESVLAVQRGSVIRESA